MFVVLFVLPNPILIASAVIPAIILLVQVYKADKLEREPPRLMLSLVVQGVVATALALLAERWGTRILSLFCTEGTAAYAFWEYFAVVGVAEEGAKYLLLKRRTWGSGYFNCQFDGVLYAVFVSLGFALWENIEYVLMYGFSTALVRAVTAVPGHACFGVFMGAWYGLAKRYDNYGYTQKSKHCRRLAFLIPVFAHGCYDFIASVEVQGYSWIFTAFIVIMFVIAFTMVRRLSKHDRYI